MKKVTLKIVGLILITISASVLFAVFMKFLTKTHMRATIYFHGKVIEVETSSVYYELGNLIITDKNGKEYIVDSDNVLLEDM